MPMKSPKTSTCLLAALAGVALATTSCVTGRAYAIVSFEELAHRTPFKATVEEVLVMTDSHDDRWPYSDSWLVVSIYLRKADGGYRLCAVHSPATDEDARFAHSLRKGQSYVFPQVLTDYYQQREQRSHEPTK